MVLKRKGLVVEVRRGEVEGGEESDAAVAMYEVRSCLIECTWYKFCVIKSCLKSLEDGKTLEWKG